MTFRNKTRALPLPPIGLLQHASLFLDFDGTLVTIVARPDAVAVEARLKNLLSRLRNYLQGRLAIISGRAAADIGTLLDNPDLVIVGSHGAEVYKHGAGLAMKGVALDGVTHALLQILLSKHPRVLIERKPLGLALHYRQAPEAEPYCRELAEQIADRLGFAVQPGKFVVELRIPGSDKGTALTALMEEAPLRDGRPIFIGDDETDEAGFHAAATRGGAGILVGEARATKAMFRLPDVDGTLSWLEAAIQASV